MSVAGSVQSKRKSQDASVGNQMDTFSCFFCSVHSLSVSVMCSLGSCCLGTLCKYFVYFFIYKK